MNLPSSAGLSRRIPCLDGLRAVSIVLVILAHGHRTPGFPRADWLPFTGTTGVCLFFVISGFLITTLLLQEEERYGRVSLRNFYMRRSLRIFPPFCLFLGFVAVLWALGVVRVDPISYFSAAAYWRNFYTGHEDWIINHTWSLAIEEQFYLLWPLGAARLSRRWALAAAVAGIASWPLLRLVRHGYLFAGDGFAALDTASMDTILFGALLALLTREPSAKVMLQRGAASGWAAAAGFVALWGLYTSCRSWPPAWTFLLPLLRNVLLAWLLWWSVNNARSWVGRCLEWKPVAGLGLISYSLYLWQQPFLGSGLGWIGEFPQCLPASLLCAWLSYRLVELPSNQWRRRWPAGGS